MADRAKHAFGSEVNVDSALESGILDAYDILFLDEKKIGWINKNGEKVILPKSIQIVDELPETGETDVLYIINTTPKELKYFDGTDFQPVLTEMTDEVIDGKIDDALAIVEF